jgi:hypothetical protein
MVAIMTATAAGEQHGLINTLTNSVAFDDFKAMKPEDRTKILKEKKEDARLVKVKYHNSRGRHERLTKAYCKYQGDPIQQWHFIPGKVYEVPFGLIKEVNEKETVRRSGFVQGDTTLDGSGAPLQEDQKEEPLHYFYPADFF